jgi:hypothetical protein
MTTPTLKISDLFRDALSMTRHETSKFEIAQRLRKAALEAGWRRVDLLHPTIADDDVELRFTPYGRIWFDRSRGVWDYHDNPLHSDAILPRVASFDVDGRTAELMTGLQKTFGVKTNAEVIRKALALASIAREQAASDNTVTIAGEGKEPVKVALAG